MTNIEQLYHKHHQPLRRYLARLLDDPATAEDVCHEAFVKVLQHCHNHSEVANTRSWLYCIAKNTAYDHLRRQRRVVMTPLAEIYEAIAGAPAPESLFVGAEPIWSTLNHLPDHYRVPLLLQLAAGYPLHTIAATLGCNVNTIKTRLHRARLRFRELYDATEESACERGVKVSRLRSGGGE